MNPPDQFTLYPVEVTVTETGDALTYTFRAPELADRPGIPFGLIILLVVYPFGLLVLTGYVYSQAANRPLWEEILVGVFAVQLLVWFVGGTAQWLRMARWWRGIGAAVLKFTRTHLRHGGTRVCELEWVRGLRLFVFPASEPEKTEAALSLVLGPDGDTHGLFSGFDPVALRAFADHLHRRLTEFRYNQGVLAPLEPLSIVETTAEDAGKLMHTRPARGGLTLAVLPMILLNRWSGIVWCVVMLAGTFALGRVILGAGLNVAFVGVLGPLGLMHLALLAYHIGGHGRPNEQPV